jgi:hypothetical protein
MKSWATAVILFAVLLLLAGPAGADRCTRHLKRLQGYTVVAVTQVDGEFQGCDFGKVIRFTDGKALRCNSYGYTYAYMPDAVIFAKTITVQGKSLATIVAWIEDDAFEMESVFLK